MCTVSLVMIVKNEESCLFRCLESVRDLVDEMVVADTGSSDRTEEIAHSFGARVFCHLWTGDFSEARNFALSKSAGDWNLILDADEYLLEGNRAELLKFLNEAGKRGRIGSVLIKSSYRDGDGIGWSEERLPRLLPRGVFYTGRIHELPAGSMERQAAPLTFGHDGYLREGKGERNLKILLEELASEPEDSYYLYQTAVTLHHLKQYENAIPYFKKFYFKAPPTAPYRASGVVLFLETLTEVGEFEEALRIMEEEELNLKDFPDFWFLCGNFYTKLVLFNTEKYVSYLPKIEFSFLRCLEIGEKPGAGSMAGTGSFKAAYNLGVWCELSGRKKEAAEFYRMACALGYEPAARRLEMAEQE